MNINKDSWHYAWYRWTYKVWDNVPPEQSNLCEYIQRTFWVTLGTGLLGILVGAMLVFYYVVMTPFAWIFGGAPINLVKNRFNDQLFTQYRGLWGWLYPWHVVAFGLFLLFEKWAFHAHLRTSIITHSVIVGAALTIFGIIWFFFDDSEAAHLARAWGSARKARVCPVVNFTNAPTSTDVNE